MSEEPQRPTSNDDRAGWKAYWQAQGMPWRTEPEIEEDRQQFLAERRAVQPDIEKAIYPFKDITLDRADVEWLLATHASDGMQGPVNWSDEKQRHRAGLDLRGADLRGAKLAKLPLARLHAGLLDEEFTMAGIVTPAQPDSEIPWTFAATGDHEVEAAAHMESTDLREAHLEGASLTHVNLTGAFLLGAHLEHASANTLQLDGAWLNGAHLDGAVVADGSLLELSAVGTHFEGANLRYTRLGGALFGAHFENAKLQGASFSELDGMAGLADVRWSGTSLALVHWVQPMRAVPRGGQERASLSKEQQKAEHSARLLECKSALRANRQLATELRSQGLNDQADRFAYRAQLLQRRVNRLQRQPARSLGSLILDLISGYGYKPLRSFLTYALVVLGFAAAYFLLRDSVHPALNPLDAVIFSITSFHGRGFMPGESITLHNPLTIFAAIEAIIGLLIEITFIATFTQRFFAR
jgi:uncharacterized protein YjbI with pentapeptide repeats